ncbi:MAG: Gfo/Idh/MocA family oxidoreductase [Candidatus Hydrogenedens sp.]|nr:Gfo/Idh/MocA family oxidoreductase [Candidatus Hydrogenedens sp.]
MKRKVRIGIIGCGAIAQELHVPEYLQSGEAEIIALSDSKHSKAKELAKRYDLSAKTYADYKDMLKKEDLDAVSVCLPNFLHCAATCDALKAGCHVLVEKPMAASMAEARKMIATADKHGKLLAVNQSQRLYPVHQKAKEVLDSGILGKILHVTAMFGHAGPEHWSPTGKWFFNKKQARFGAMADLGVHKADLIRFLTGKEVAEVNAFYECLEKKRSSVEDNFVSTLKFTDGTIGTLAASWTVKGMDANYTILHCANGSLRICLIPGRPLVANLINPECEIVFDTPEAPSNDALGWGLDTGGHFCRAIKGLEPLFCSGVEGMKSLEIILAAEEAAKTRRTVKLSRK